MNASGMPKGQLLSANQPVEGGRGSYSSSSSVWLDLSASARPERSVILLEFRLRQQTRAHARRNRSHTHTQRLSRHTTGCTSAWLANPCGAVCLLNDTRHPLCGNQQCTDVSLAHRHAVPEAAMRATLYNMMPHTHTQAAHGLNTLDKTRQLVWKPTDTIVSVILFSRRLQQQTSTNARRNRSHTHTQRLSQHTTGCTLAWLANPCGAARPLNETMQPLCDNQPCTDVSLAQRQAVPEATFHIMMPHRHKHTHTAYTPKKI